MNNKGFTLIELIMVIAILAMLSLLATPNVIKLIEKNKVDNYNSTIDSIIEATKLYVSDNRYTIFNKKDINDNLCNIKYDSDKDGDIDVNDITPETLEYKIYLNNLITSEDISAPVKNPCADKDISEVTEINVTLDCKTKQFSYAIDLENKGDAGVSLDGTVLLSLDDVTESNGKIIEGKTCDDLYGE